MSRGDLACICFYSVDDGCGGEGIYRCDPPCGGDFCVCLACCGNGETHCSGCPDCEDYRAEEETSC